MLTIRIEEKSSFFLYSVWWPRWDPQGHPTHSRACRWDLVKTDRTQQKIRMFTENLYQFSQISLRGVWSRKEGKISFCSFLSKCNLSGKTFVRIRSLNRDSWICFWVPIGYWRFLRNSYCLVCSEPTWFSACLGCVGSCVCSQPNLHVGGSKVWLDRNVTCAPLATMALLTIVCSGEFSEFLFLLVIF